MIPHKNGEIDIDVQEAITLTVMCQEFRALPGAGGLLDQDAYHVWVMEQVVRAQREKEAREADKKKIPGNKPR